MKGEVKNLPYISPSTKYTFYSIICNEKRTSLLAGERKAAAARKKLKLQEMRIPCPPLKLPIWWVNAHRIRISSTLVDCGRWWGWWKDLAFTHPNAVSFSCSSRLVAVLRWPRSWVVGICLALLLWEIIRFYYIIQYSFYFGGGEFCSCVSGGGWRITISWSPDIRRYRVLEYCVKMCSSRMMLGKGEHETRIQSRNSHVMQGGCEWVRRKSLSVNLCCFRSSAPAAALLIIIIHIFHLIPGTTLTSCPLLLYICFSL